MLPATVLRKMSVPPKRPSNAACRYSGRPSRYFDVAVQASALSLNSPLGITCGLGQFVSHHLTRQRRIQRLAPALGALVARHVDLVVVRLFYRRLGLCSQALGLVEEHVLLVMARDLAAGREQPTREFVELLLHSTQQL